MNLTDLSRELRSRADEVHATPATTRLAQVRSRIRIRRRRQAMGAVVIAVAGVAALVFGIHVDVDALRGSSDPANHVPAIFDQMLAGDPLVASEIGARGQRDVRLEFTPADNFLQLTYLCRAAGVTELTADTTVNGHPFGGAQCESSAAADTMATPGGMTAEENRAGWAALGVLPGRKSVIRIRVTTPPAAGQEAIDSSLVLGIGVYALTGERVTSDGAVIKVDAESGGHDYRLRGYRTAHVTAGAHDLSLRVPAGARPAYVTAGIVEDEGKTGRSTTRLGVDDDPTVSEADGGIMSQALEDARAHTIHIRADTAGGVLLLAYYTRVD